MEKIPVGRVAHFYDKIGVAVIELSDTLKQGDKISIEGQDGGFEQAVDSMQIEHEQVMEAKKGQAIGMKVAQPVKPNWKVFKIVE